MGNSSTMTSSTGVSTICGWAVPSRPHGDWRQILQSDFNSSKVGNVDRVLRNSSFSHSLSVVSLLPPNIDRISGLRIEGDDEPHWYVVFGVVKGFKQCIDTARFSGSVHCVGEATIVTPNGTITIFDMPSPSAVVGVSNFAKRIGNIETKLSAEVSKSLLGRHSRGKIKDVPNNFGLRLNGVRVDDSQVGIKIAYDDVILTNDWCT